MLIILLILFLSIYNIRLSISETKDFGIKEFIQVKDVFALKMVQNFMLDANSYN